MLKKRLFIIDDEADMIRIATDLLEPEGFLVLSAKHPEQGLKTIRANPPDILLLDVRLPDKDGFEVLREIKADAKTHHVPVIMVSVKADEADVVIGLEFGADDYVAKPFRKRELLARIKAVLRRREAHPNEQKVELGPLHLDYARYVATINKHNIDLTPKEFELLGYLMQRIGRVNTRAAMSEAVWGTEYLASTRTIDVHVDTLRRKLGKLGSWIVGLKGVGYRFDPDV